MACLPACLGCVSSASQRWSAAGAAWLWLLQCGIGYRSDCDQFNQAICKPRVLSVICVSLESVIYRHRFAAAALPSAVQPFWYACSCDSIQLAPRIQASRLAYCGYSAWAVICECATHHAARLHF